MKNVNITLKLTSDKVQTTESVGESLGKQLQTADVICLIGELGAGKTALTRGIGRGWGTAQRVTSPTFTLINEYARPSDESILYHLDCYRLLSADDVETIGLEDILAADGAVIIEWPNIASDWLPADYLTIEIEHDPEDEDIRYFTFIANGTRSKIILENLKEDIIDL